MPHRHAPSLRSALFGLALTLIACQGEEPQNPAATEPSSAASTLVAPEDPQTEKDSGAQQKRGTADKANERIAVPAGRFSGGSTPGDSGRDPSLEANEQALSLSAFSIDKLPYPNDPQKPARTGITRAQAEALCAERDGRLCNEFEWERACKGKQGSRYAGGQRFDPSCKKKPNSCASGFGVLNMGAQLREWTASQVLPSKKYRNQTSAAVRGAGPAAADIDRRCARRSALDASIRADDLGFRCCYGTTNTYQLPAPQWQNTVKRVSFPAERLQKLFASDPKLKLISKDVKYFRNDAAVATVKRRRKARGLKGDAAVPKDTYLTTSPVIWNPIPGAELLVATGQANGKHSFVVALHKLNKDRYRLATIMVMKNEPGPVVIVYNPFRRRKLEWTMCWDCYGETGNISYRNEHRVVVTQK